MVNINGAIYIVLGLFLAIFSLILNIKNKNSKLILFLWMGIGMILWGIIKIVSQRKERQKQAPVHANNTVQQQFVKYCSRCGAALRNIEQFCNKCGSKAFHRR